MVPQMAGEVAQWKSSSGISKALFKLVTRCLWTHHFFLSGCFLFSMALSETYIVHEVFFSPSCQNVLPAYCSVSEPALFT